MIDKMPEIRTQTAECSEERRTPVQSAQREEFEIETVSVSGKADGRVHAERVATGGHPHTGWFHRSGRGTVQWIPAQDDRLQVGPPEPTRRYQRFPAGADAVTGPCTVSAVKGRRPVGLDDFRGVTSFTVIQGDLTYRVFGTGERTPDGVLFRQQDLGADGKEIRTWRLTAAQDGIVAEPHPAG